MESPQLLSSPQTACLLYLQIPLALPPRRSPTASRPPAALPCWSLSSLRPFASVFCALLFVCLPLLEDELTEVWPEPRTAAGREAAGEMPAERKSLPGIPHPTLPTPHALHTQDRSAHPRPAQSQSLGPVSRSVTVKSASWPPLGTTSPLPAAHSAPATCLLSGSFETPGLVLPQDLCSGYPVCPAKCSSPADPAASSRPSSRPLFKCHLLREACLKAQPCGPVLTPSIAFPCLFSPKPLVAVQGPASVLGVLRVWSPDPRLEFWVGACWNAIVRLLLRLLESGPREWGPALCTQT